MAKVRVYELAKKLNMENKELVDKLKAGGLNIKNYMSTLDEETSRRAMEIVSGTRSEVIKEEAPTEVKGLPQKEKEVAGKEEAVKEEGILDEAKAPELAAIPVSKKVKKKSKDRPARIIKMPDEKILKNVMPKEKGRPLVEKPVELPHLPKIKIAGFEEEEEEEKPFKKKRDKRKAERRKEEESRVRIRHHKLEVFEKADLYEERGPRLKDRKGIKKGKDVVKKMKQTEITVPREKKRRLKVQGNETVGELARAMGGT